MQSIRRRLTSIAAIAILGAAVAIIIPASGVAAASRYTCMGGSIPGGSYGSVLVKGPCTVDAGTVTVAHQFIVGKSGELLAAFGSSNLRVAGSLVVRSKGILVLGCEPDAFPCLDDPTLTTNEWVGGDLLVRGALASIVHHTRIGHSLYQLNGGGGVNCDSQPALQGSPYYGTYEDVNVGGNVTIVGMHSCWLGLIRTHVAGSVFYSNNVMADPDANEVVTNVIGGDLVCTGNSPAPQVGDSTGNLNVVGHMALFQCAGLTV